MAKQSREMVLSSRAAVPVESEAVPVGGLPFLTNYLMLFKKKTKQQQLEWRVVKRVTYSQHGQSWFLQAD